MVRSTYRLILTWGAWFRQMLRPCIGKIQRDHYRSGSKVQNSISFPTDKMAGPRGNAGPACVLGTDKLAEKIFCHVGECSYFCIVFQDGRAAWTTARRALRDGYTQVFGAVRESCGRSFILSFLKI